tara:strand:+ start:4738 stop:4908 length:171 start_codon:yes stop_codon:yes gene_type:complete
MTEQEYRLLKSKMSLSYDEDGVPQIDYIFDDLALMPILKKAKKEDIQRAVDELKAG